MRKPWEVLLLVNFKMQKQKYIPNYQRWSVHQGQGTSWIMNSEDLLFMLKSYPTCTIRSFLENLTRETFGSTELCPSILLFFGVLVSEQPYLSLSEVTFLNIQLGSFYKPFSAEISPVFLFLPLIDTLLIFC